MLQTLKTTYNKPLIALQTNSSKTSQFNINEPFALECGEVFDSLTISYSTYGQLNQARDNVIWVCHALTADANPKDWWQGLVGKHDLFNPDEHFIVCANVIGSPYGSTSPLNCDEDKRFDAFPQVSIRDNVKAFIQLRKHLGIDKIHTLIGGSMGGHQAMEWAISEPEIVEKLILLATSAVLS
ncbi:MAG TPA: alpha/beta fold hydrolase, partial [Oceanospirillales bacterium]|nr:alpha/beta fold hydrolase [Oceanospirillales bacterium]